jgi:hypothetical protein
MRKIVGLTAAYINWRTNERCYAILELEKEVGIDKICEVYEDRCDVKLFLKNLIERR